MSDLDVQNINSKTGNSAISIADDGTTTVSTFTSTGIDDNATSTAITIDASENVGIGTASPQKRLHISGPSGGDAGISFTNSISGESSTDGLLVTLNSDGTNATFWNYENGYMRFATNSTERMRITSSGNVGIGTNDPDTKLHLSESVGSTFTFERTGSSAGNGVIKSIGNTGTENSRITLGGGTNNALIFGTGSSGLERMRIDASGNVGIGTSSPANKLDVNGILQSSSVGNYLQLQQSSSDGYINMTGSGGINFRLGSGFDTRMTITSAGNVGIGTTSPSAKLEVLGNSEILSLRYASNGGSALLAWKNAGGTTLWDMGGGIVATQDEFAIRRQGSSKFLINSNGDISAGTTSVAGSLYAGAHGSRIGNVFWSGGNFYFNGFIDDLRITKGVARYTAAFTPPTAAFPDL